MAVAIAAVATLGAYLFLDEWAIEWAERNPREWRRNAWYQAATQFGKTWAPIWLLMLAGSIG